MIFCDLCHFINPIFYFICLTLFIFRMIIRNITKPFGDFTINTF